MQYLVERVKETYDALVKSNLTATKTVTDTNLHQFRKILDRLAAPSASEIAARLMVSYLYDTDPVAFTDYLNKSKLRCLMLIVNLNEVIADLGLKDVIEMAWISNNIHVRRFRGSTATRQRRHSRKGRNQQPLPAMPVEEVKSIIKQVKTYKDAIINGPDKVKVDLTPDPSIKSWADIED